MSLIFGAVLIAWAALFPAEAKAQTDAETNEERLAKLFSPILILTEETGGKWGNIKVTKPEPVGIMGATSADNIWFEMRALDTGPPDADDRLGSLILEAGQIDSCTVEVGVPAVVICGLGYRDPVTGQWPRLTRARGVLQAVNSQRLLLGAAESGRSQRIDLSRIQTLTPEETSVSFSASRDTVQAQTGSVDSLAVKEKRRPPDIENLGLRLLAKVAVGTVSGAFTGLGWVVAGGLDPRRLLLGAAIGSSVAFPLGASLVDPHDSWPKTLLAGVIPAVAAYSFARISPEHTLDALLFVYVVPVIGSLIVSEVSRKPPQDRCFSFGLAPNPASGLSAVAKLHF